MGIIAPGLTEAKAKALMAGPWEEWESLSKISSGEAIQTIRWRLEDGGATVRLRGLAKAEEEIKSGEVIGRLPKAAYPLNNVYLAVSESALVSAHLEVNNAGQVLYFATAALAANKLLYLDGLTFNIT